MELNQIKKPLLRGHFHQAGFFIAIGACSMLIAISNGMLATIASVIYSASLVGLYGTSALYHRINWKTESRVWMKRLDHAAIFILIAGTATPICLIALKDTVGLKLLILFWGAALLGVFKVLFWVHSPKWVSAIFYVAMGWLAVPYMSEMSFSMGIVNVWLMVIGGIIYSVGAIFYATKWPAPHGHIFGYHELFHIFVIIASVFHFIVVFNLVKT